jgi:hypothetical protein
MAIESASAKTFSIGSVISNSFTVIGHNFVTFAIIAALSEIPSIAFSWLITGLNPFVRAQLTVHAGTSRAAYAGMFIAGMLLSLIFTYVLQAALIYGTVSDLNGRRASFGACLATGLRSFIPLAAIAILVGLGVGVGFVLLIVPGIILALGWSVAIPVRVIEHTPIFGVFGRSWQLTSGHRGSIFGLFLILFLGAIGLQLAILPFSGATFGGIAPVQSSLIYIALAVIVRVVLAMFGATMIGVLYYELRSVKEGVGPEALAAVFD